MRWSSLACSISSFLFRATRAAAAAPPSPLSSGASNRRHKWRSRSFAVIVQQIRLKWRQLEKLAIHLILVLARQSIHRAIRPSKRRIMSGGRVNACVYPPNPIIPTGWRRPTDGRLHILLCLSDNGASERGGNASRCLVGRQSMDSLIRQMIALRGGRNRKSPNLAC